jgi:mono/diheme cytochrome c family protein
MLRGELALSLLCALTLSAPGAAADADKVDFTRHIRPILSDKCFTCHGPDEQARMVNLRLDTREGAFADRGGYQVIVPGDAAASRLFQRLTHKSEALRMPPKAAGERLTEKEIDLIRRWIDQGAEWRTHWAYVAPQRPPVPEVRNNAWPRNPIDRFILATLERQGLKPSPEAGKATLLRRLSLDLTGLPPSPAEVDAFLADRSPNAYDKQVDRLLASPRYGERMALEWLDLARYADTHGYHIDSHRDMWPWRDWVIDAFNRNLRYDRFTLEQLAGDLLTNPTRSQLVATGFNRNHMINFEGGAIEEEYLAEYVVDRVEATSNVWLGTTMGCARCHDHKYDPFTQKDFYRLFAFFNTVEEKGLDGRAGNAKPILQLPTPGEERRLDALVAELKAKEETFPEQGTTALLEAWRQTRSASMPAPSRDGLIAHYEMEGGAVDTSGSYHHGRQIRGDIIYSSGQVGRAADFNGETHFEFPGAAGLEFNQPFSIALWLRTSGKPEAVVFQKVDSSDTRRGFQLEAGEIVPLPPLKRGQHLSFRLIHRWPDDALEIRTKDLVLQDWRHVAINYDGSGQAAGLGLFLDGKPAETVVVRDHLTGSVRSSSPLEIGSPRASFRPFQGRIDDLRFYCRLLESHEVVQLARDEPIRAMVTGVTPKPKREADAEAFEARLRSYFLRYDAPEHLRNLYLEIEDLRAEKEKLDKAIVTTMVMAEMENPRETFVLGRGDYRNLGEKVAPGVPSALPPLPPDAPPNRLGLAQWLVDPAHPLTARVAVNRFWQMYFGAGIVKTAEDFGSQGEAPSHPELLDWLATEFVASGWDVKAMQRLIVTSAAYRQSSRVTPELLEIDPENRLLTRGPRFRLKAEILRDNALAVSGLLNGQIGGPPVFPYQPPGIWEDVAYGDFFTAQVYTPGHGQDLYRRSMYTFWKRTAPPPSLATFDAPDREKCIARRARTNTPLQALVLLNDPTYVEAARALAQRMIREAGRDPGRRIDFAFRHALARSAAPKQRQVLRDLAERELATYRRNPEAAQKLLTAGESEYDKSLDPVELAAWAAVASVILNLDETITRQ